MSGYYEPPFDPAAPQYDTDEPVSPFDRIEAAVRQRITINAPDGPELPTWVDMEDVLALLEIARAAQAYRSAILARHPEYTFTKVELAGRDLDAALARLEQDTT